MKRNHYNTSDGKIKTLIAILCLVAMVAACVVTFATDTEPATWDSVHPITNAAISWEQTYYGGRMAE